MFLSDLDEPVHEKQTIWVPTRSDINRPIQSQMHARTFGFKMK